MKNRIFSIDSPKAIKAQKLDNPVINAIMYMAPARVAGVGNLCGDSSDGCVKLCLGEHSGAAIYYPTVMLSRIAKAKRFMKARADYMDDVIKAIHSVKRKAAKQGFPVVIRLNGSTDIAWESIKTRYNLSLINMFSDDQFDDYTKSFKRAMAYATGKMPKNYCVVFSRSEKNESQCLDVLRAGGKVAVVFGYKLPETWNGFPVVNGDEHDLVHLHPPGVVIGLSPKGHKAKKDTSGFVVR
jgi:hypothetical protein